MFCVASRHCCESPLFLDKRKQKQHICVEASKRPRRASDQETDWTSKQSKEQHEKNCAWADSHAFTELIISIIMSALAAPTLQ